MNNLKSNFYYDVFLESNPFFPEENIKNFTDELWKIMLTYNGKNPKIHIESAMKNHKINLEKKLDYLTDIYISYKSKINK